MHDDERSQPNFILIFIHKEDDIQETAWPTNFPLPRWGESFVWNNEEFVIEDSGWVLQEVSIDGTPEGAKAAAITYHIHIAPEEDASPFPIPRP